MPGAARVDSLPAAMGAKIKRIHGGQAIMPNKYPEFKLKLPPKMRRRPIKVKINDPWYSRAKYTLSSSFFDFQKYREKCPNLRQAYEIFREIYLAIQKQTAQWKRREAQRLEAEKALIKRMKEKEKVWSKFG
jgi:hypothetical protein